jgi:hypothetical protein
MRWRSPARMGWHRARYARWFPRTDAVRFRRYVIRLLIALALRGLVAAAWRLVA